MTSHAKQPSLNPNLINPDLHHPLHAWQCPDWVRADLQRMADHLKEGNVLGEVGFGAGHLTRCLGAPSVVRVTIELPFHPSSATVDPWPVKDDSIDFLVSFDALQYVEDVKHFLREASRITTTTQLFALVVRDREDLEADGLARYFPNAVESAKPLLPEVPVLEKLLAEEGMYCMRRAKLEGQRQIDAEVLERIAHRDMLGLSTLTEEEFGEGVNKLRDAVGHGDTVWPSQYTILVTRKIRPWRPAVGQTEVGTGEMGGGMGGGGMGSGQMGGKMS